MRDLKLRELTTQFNFPKTGYELMTKPCRITFSQFARNLAEARAMMEAPYLASFSAQALVEAQHFVFFKEFGTPYPGIERINAEKERLGPLVDKRALRNLQEVEKESIDMLREGMTENLDKVLQISGRGTVRVFESLLAAHAVQSWTVIEVLIEDLHKTAVENHPNCFRNEVVDKHIRGRDDLKGSRYSYRSRRLFSEAYADAFNDNPTIDAILTHQSLLGLALLRNVITHRAGVADKIFMDTDLKIAPNLYVFQPAPNKPLVFDGFTLHNFITLAYTKAIELTIEVDKWLRLKGAPDA